MARHWKILGTSFLALVGVFAMNATAAQAKWILLVENKSVSVLQFVEKFNKQVVYFLAETGATVRCNLGDATGKASLNESKTVMSGSTTLVFTGCGYEGFEEICPFHSPGKVNGTIVVSFNFEVKMNGSEVYLEPAENVELAEIQYLGEECPFIAALAMPMTGRIKVALLSPLSHMKLHEIRLEGINLWSSDGSLELHMFGAKGEPLKLISGSIEEASGQPFSMHLEELPGCAPLC